MVASLDAYKKRFPPFYTSLLNKKKKFLFAFLLSLWGISLIFFWEWWLQLSHVTNSIGIVVNSIILFWSTVLPGYYFFFVWRSKRINPILPLPNLRVAMIITKAPSEPWGLVQKTVSAALSQIYPKSYDVWLADEDPDEGTISWCKAHNVSVSTRKGIPEYNNETWPRRKRCKEGNLAYFYDMYGYTQYDVVVQLDADHIPDPDYLTHMVRPFCNEQIGYVSAPSICDANSDKSWTVNARLYMEASMHGSLQAGYNDGYAPLCIGSHYAVRTKALRSIGGLGPELAEDHSTTLMMNAGEWKGAFAIDAIAHGDGAVGIEDSMIQEFQWSRSLMNLLLLFSPRLIKTLPRQLKIQFIFSELWYPLFALIMFCSYILPLVALFNNTPWVNVSYVEFLIHMGGVTLLCLLTVYWIQKQGIFRPANAKVLSWETILFQFVRWPWVVYGVVMSIAGVILHKNFSFRVTPKGQNEFKLLNGKVLLPYFIIAFVYALSLFFLHNGRRVEGYYYFSLLNCIEYFLIICILIGLHLYENRVYLTLKTLSTLTIPFTEMVLLGIWVFTAFILRFNDAVQIFYIR